MYHAVQKPEHRSALRALVGKEYFILKRKLRWVLQDKQFARVNPAVSFPNIVYTHKSFLLRPLKDVDMVLQYNKVTNLACAIFKLNHVVINPGQTFSLWQLVGRPTKAKGYLEGLILHNGTITKGIGGGLCQLGNLLYWMALHTPLTVTERWRHSYDVFPDCNRTIPFGCGATLSYNYVDLQITNNTDTAFQINLWLDDEYLNGEITSADPLNESYLVYETDHMFQHQWWGGYTRHNKIWKRITSLTDNSVREELITENNAIMMYNPMLEK